MILALIRELILVDPLVWAIQIKILATMWSKYEIYVTAVHVKTQLAAEKKNCDDFVGNQNLRRKTPKPKALHETGLADDFFPPSVVLVFML